MFRASPWISYSPSTEPQPPNSSATDLSTMDEDVDMDAPQISTLRDEESPPPARVSKFRVKLLVKQNKGAGVSTGSASRRPSLARQNAYDEEEEDEEDQLIDDDDDDDTSTKVSAPVPASRPAESSSKRKTTAKRRPRKSDRRVVEEEKKAKEKAQVQDPEMDVEAPKEEPLPATPAPPEPVKVPTKRKAAPKKSATGGTPRARKASSRLAKSIPLSLPEDTGVLSEGYTVTAASSPIPAHHDANSPEPESIPPTAVQEEFNFDTLAMPVYPLPSKPYPVQPPPKIATGFAPFIPLDRSGKKVRHWRTAHREIRGIAGGRWVARSWVGEKESEFASVSTSASAAHRATDGVSLPKLSSVSISAPVGRGSGKFKVPKAQSVASSSRAGSAVPDPHAVRAPTKMRSILTAPSSEAGNDSDMAPPSVV